MTLDSNFIPCPDPDCPGTDTCGSIYCWGTGRNGIVPTKDLLVDSDHVCNLYEEQCTQIWDDMVFEFALKWKLEEEEAKRLLEASKK